MQAKEEISWHIHTQAFMLKHWLPRFMLHLIAAIDYYLGEILIFHKPLRALILPYPYCPHFRGPKDALWSFPVNKLKICLHSLSHTRTHCL